MLFRVADKRIGQKKHEVKAPSEPEFLRQRVDDYYTGRKVELWQGRHPLQGRSPRPGDIKVRSNDYLCLAGHPHVIEAEIAALRAGGHGDAVSRVWVHHERDVIREFEQRVAALMRAEDAVLCSSGYTANVGLIQSFATRGAPVYLDMKAHISLHEGVTSAGATPVLFRHNDPQSLDKMLAANGPGLVAIDALYSTDGDIAPMAELVAVCERHGAALVIDETHSFGAQGPDGAGLVVAVGLAERVHFRTIGLSKAVASRGGLIVCSRRNAEYFRYKSLPAIFSTSVMQHEVAGFDAVLDILQREDWRRDKLHANHAYLKQGLDRSATTSRPRRRRSSRSSRAISARRPSCAMRSSSAAFSAPSSFRPPRPRSAASSASRSTAAWGAASSTASSRSVGKSARKSAWPNGAQRGASTATPRRRNPPAVSVLR